MAKYFDYDVIKSDSMADLFTTVEKKPYGFFRVILTPDKMLYFDKYNNRFPLIMGIVNYMDAKGTIHQVLFNRQNLNMNFQAIGKQDDCLVFCMNTDSCHIEKELLWGGAEWLLIMLRTTTSVVFIGYDGSYENITVTFFKDYDNEQPSVAALLQRVWGLPRR